VRVLIAEDQLLLRVSINCARNQRRHDQVETVTNDRHHDERRDERPVRRQ